MLNISLVNNNHLIPPASAMAVIFFLQITFTHKVASEVEVDLQCSAVLLARDARILLTPVWEFLSRHSNKPISKAAEV